jgi:hypothetical protein
MEKQFSANKETLRETEVLAAAGGEDKEKWINVFILYSLIFNL